MKEKHGSEVVSEEELDFINDSRSAVLDKMPAWTSLTAYFVVAIMAITLLWATFASIHVSTTVFGKVVSTTNLQVIQHLEGGIVKVIHVKDGQLVKKDQILVTLDDTSTRAVYQRDLTKQALLRLEVARLEAESMGKDALTVEPGIEKDYPTLVSNTKTLFENNKNALATSVALLNESYDLTRKELGIVAPLAARGAISQLEKLRLEQELTRIKTDINTKISAARDAARDALNRSRADLSVLDEQIATSLDKLTRTEIRSPMDGIVNRLNTPNIGTVLTPGSKVAEVVPMDNQLTVEVKVPTNEIGFIKIGQDASVKINAYEFSVYGNLRGKVNGIGADALTDADGKDYYLVKLQTDKNYLQGKGEKLYIRPGMSVTVNLLTGKRSILSYLIKPLVDIKSGN